ncbi:MAG: methyltransferase domain-containing protein [Nanoarchaeota archaeon]|nr:methyltransferase domain-containing protein [Nanoarchaeota archaeon]
MKIFRKIGDKLFYRGGIFHPTKGICLGWEKDLETAIKDGKKIINIGAGQYHRPGTISIDPFYEKEDEFHIKAFGENLPFENNLVDFVICNAVLEHVKEPRKIVNEIYRVLKPGGRMYVDIPFIYPFHAAPSDYNRMTLVGFEHLCEDFEKIDSGMCLGPNSALAQFLVTYSQVLFKNKILKKLSKNIAKILVFPMKYFDRFFVKNKEALNLAGGFYFYGKKK